MSRAASRKRGNPKDTKRRGKKKISILSSEKIEYVDYKDVDLLKRFMSDRAKIKSRRVNGNDVQQQRVIARAIKNAREMGLLPYTNRVTTQRRSRDRGDGPRRPREDERPTEETEVPEGVEVEAAEAAPPVENIESVETAEGVE
ncbi:MAG: 30S ribosomal protein S18 [Acidimicrobiales bacterium]|nr:30S ribosomal protein S18 [Acidimicrobiales bacterium]